MRENDLSLFKVNNFHNFILYGETLDHRLHQKMKIEILENKVFGFRFRKNETNVDIKCCEELVHTTMPLKKVLQLGVKNHQDEIVIFAEL